MKVFDAKKESSRTEYDYDSIWKEDENEEVEKKIKELPKGEPRIGLTGKYIKKKHHVGKLQLKKSYGSYFKNNPDNF
ncbi:MAG: hypothetical protein WC867_06635 [Candidatus Pacearchaeota archaeon]|jgi:hypothetical protein